VRLFDARKETERSVLLNWLLHHRRLAIWVFCLLLATLIAMLIAAALLSGSKTFTNAWYV
jgi:hypothetical protein